MKKFILKTLLFALVTGIILIYALLLMPNPAIEHNMMSALLDKHKRLEQTPSPRIIFIGGSNLSFGLDSKKIEEQLQIPVVNAGLHAAIGMKYYLNDIKPYIRKGDLVILSPEYGQFYTDAFYGRTELVCVLFDVYREGQMHLDFRHWCRLLKFIPGYAVSKLKPTKKRSKNQTISVYDRKAFNEHGDAFIHWNLPRKYIKPASPISADEQVSGEVVSFIEDFEDHVNSLSADFLIVPPAYQSSSYANHAAIIDSVMQALAKADLPVISMPEKYRFDDSLFFDTYYHLTKPGIDIRTRMLIDDLRMVVKRD
ncbi:hypothetical protein LZD49_28745 [Dyadobacter sp. CY261]|uniref:hypothetical protein n=1 Tax=Dyadobacter sp. CY261 TaxID=2907203 RepID=UPI001F27C658|nr:hypothetical protein [Dyadobacter sp. CY261]MCF0074508.1 hypothetical protein [Dyadobacter sp. CY261]